jgi:20S proteasome subunit alpha 2
VNNGKFGRINFSFYSPSGKLMQIEYAMNAVKNGLPSVALKGFAISIKNYTINSPLAKDCVVLATENKQSVMYAQENKIHQLTKHIGCVYSGMGPDYRMLIRKARKVAAEYELQYGEEIPVTQIVSKIAAIMQEYTQSGFPFIYVFFTKLFL